jgi:hypothetical protein
MITAEEKLTRSNAVISPDRRGLYQRQQSPDTIERNRVVKEHIDLFPKVPSHLCRAETTKLYLEANLNVAKMHRLYLEWKVENSGLNPASLRQYRDMFNSFNFSFFTPRKE